MLSKQQYDSVRRIANREDRLFYANELFETLDIFYPFSRRWGPVAGDLWYKPKLSNQERFNLWIFLYGNGLEPSLISYWIPIGRNFSISDYRQMQQLQRQARGHLLDRYTYYDIETQRVRAVGENYRQARSATT